MSLLDDLAAAIQAYSDRAHAPPRQAVLHASREVIDRFNALSDADRAVIQADIDAVAAAHGLGTPARFEPYDDLR